MYFELFCVCNWFLELTTPVKKYVFPMFPKHEKLKRTQKKYIYSLLVVIDWLLVFMLVEIGHIIFLNFDVKAERSSRSQSFMSVKLWVRTFTRYYRAMRVVEEIKDFYWRLLSQISRSEFPQRNQQRRLKINAAALQKFQIGNLLNLINYFFFNSLGIRRKSNK